MALEGVTTPGPGRLFSPGHVSLFTVLERYEIGSQRAALAARTVFWLWETTDVEPILRQLTLRKRNHNPCGPEFNQHRSLGIGPKVFIFLCLGGGLTIAFPLLFVHSTWSDYGLGKLLRLLADMSQYVKTPLDLVRQSIQQRAALCVNRDGKFQVMTSGFSVMSHVWGETMGWNSPEGFGKVDLSLRKKGIHRTHFLKFFDRCNATWLWVDVLAMPEVLEDMSPHQQCETEALRVGVINNLNSIYQNADKVVVLDSLVLQLKTGSLVDVAVVLCLGRWMTRMWTLTEARLGQRVLIKTEDGEANLDEIISFLEEESLDTSHRYAGLARTLSTKRGATPPRARHDLADLTAACRFAQTGEAIDNIRALYPLLGLKWEVDWDERGGVLNLKETLPAESEALVTLCRERGLPDPFGFQQTSR
ncbi:putative monocarboxylate transporter [Colletotrichum incanum]|nr:putative monocarboxylate transporter [Colletotrichum incanum]